MRKTFMVAVALLLGGSVMADVFYLHMHMTTASTNNNPTLKTIWYDDPVGGTAMANLVPVPNFTGNQFDVNGYVLRSPNSAGTANFVGTFAVGKPAPLAELLTGTWNVAGMNIGSTIQMRLRQNTVNLNVASVEMGGSGELKFRTYSSGGTSYNNLNLSITDLSGSGLLGFGDSAFANDANGAWNLAVTANTFAGTVGLVRGQLTFANALAMDAAAFTVASDQVNTVVIGNNVTFGSMNYGATAVSAGEYAASDLNTLLNTDRFSGAGTLTVIPESATLGLLGMGSLIVLIVRRFLLID